MTDAILHRYRRLIVNELPADGFIQFRYRITTTSDLDIRGSAIRILLILSQRTIMPLGFEDARKSDIATIGAVVVPSGSQQTEHITVALPLHVVSEREGLTQIVLTAASAAEYSYASEVWLDDIVLPPSVLSWFRGPRLGVQGIRERLGIHDRPLLGYVVKSRTRASLATVVASCEEALHGGVDLLVDDLLSTDPEGALSFERRVPALAQLVREFNARSRVGESRAGYVVNVGASSRRAEAYVDIARRAGALGGMVDCFTMGFGNVHDLIEREHAEAGDRGLAFFATNMGSGMMGRNPDDERMTQELSARRFLRTGLSETLTAKLSRMAGADGVHTGSSGTECFEIAEYAHTPRALRSAFDGLRASFAIAEGDIQLPALPANIVEMGVDVIIETASGIANHPAGVRDGARAFRLVLGCLNEELTLEDTTEVLNVLRHRFPETVGVLLGSWKKAHDERIRRGWSAEASAKALASTEVTAELGAILANRGRRKVAR